MGKFTHNTGDRVETADGRSGEIIFRDAGSPGYQDRYAVATDENGTIVYFDEELRKES